MARDRVSAGEPGQEAFEASFEVFKHASLIRQDVITRTAAGANLKPNPLVVMAMMVLAERARPATAGELAARTGQSAAAMANALTRFCDGPGSEFVSKEGIEYSLTRRGWPQARRYANASAARLARLAADFAGSTAARPIDGVAQ